MKILHVNHLLDPVTGGGTAERTYQLTRFLMKEGVECGILTLDVGSVDKVCEELKPAQIYRLWCLNRRYFIPVFSIFKLAKLIRSYDAVHIMGHWTILNALAGICCLICRIPYVVCPAGALRNFGRSRHLKSFYDAVIGKLLVRNASAWVAITEAEKDDFQKYGVNLTDVRVIPNGIDPDLYDLPIDNGQALDTLAPNLSYILFLGRLNQIKGPDLLLAAFIKIAERFPNVELVFAGPDAGMQQSLMSTANGSDYRNRVHFVGHVSGLKKVTLIKNAICMVIPSRHEAMSIVVLEAGVCGTPVIFTDECGLEDFAAHGAGIRVEASADSIYEGLLTAVSRPNEMKESGEHLRELVFKCFLWDAQARKYKKLFQIITLKQ